MSSRRSSGDGSADDFAERLARWKMDAGFLDGKHGTILPVSPTANGSSGAKVVKRYLDPRKLDAARVTFTDVYPVFHIKSSSGKKRGQSAGRRKKREQADAIHQEYDPIASRMGMPSCSLPARIPAGRLPALAASTFGETLVADLAAAGAPVVITLGEEVWETLVAIPRCGLVPRGRSSRISTAMRTARWAASW